MELALFAGGDNFKSYGGFRALCCAPFCDIVSGRNERHAVYRHVVHWGDSYCTELAVITLS